jgi:hypothetical protein
MQIPAVGQQMMAILPAVFLSSAIKSVNEMSTARFGNTILAISSGFPIDSEAFDLYDKERIIQYLQEYGSVVGW